MKQNDLIRVLGPVDVLLGDRAVPIGSHHGRAMLAALVVSAGHAVPMRQIEAALWGDCPPLAAEDLLHTYASRLRHILGHDAIQRCDHMYRLDVARDQIDALQFEDLLQQAAAHRADPATCLDLSRRALALWRGEAFGDLADDDAFRLESMRLDELRVAAMELALESELALGNSRLVVAELQSAVEEHPFREPLWYLLIRALRDERRRLEAAQTCQRLRSLLHDEGLEPASELRQLEASLVDEDPGTDESPRPERARPTAPRGAPPRRPGPEAVSWR